MLKYIAIITMLLDHINHILYHNQYYILTVIGRFAFPIFIYLGVKSYSFYTHDKFIYMLRILLFAFLSLPFTYFGFAEFLPLNILFSIFLGLFTIYLIENKIYIWSWFPLALSLYCDYSFYSVIAFLSMYLFLNQKNIINFLFLLISLFLLNPIIFNIYLPIFLILILFDLYIKFDFRSSLNKYFFYVFYPLHIAFLGVLK